ncbi:MAG TPA: hypothetical protein VFU73_04995 [Actinocrinis sp.]|nr:hypothetical protein [Actinocrinis sp.]
MTALAHSGAQVADAQIADEPTLPPSAAWLPVEPPFLLDVPPPGPVLAPYLGLVSAVMCALGGGWLLLAPYALDYRHGAEHTPRTTEIDLGTGAAAVALAIASALLFALSLARRLHGSGAVEMESAPEREAVAESGFEAEPRALGGEPEPGILVEETVEEAGAGAPEPAPERPADPGNALRDLLTPLVAALAADLKLRGDHPDGSSRL